MVEHILLRFLIKCNDFASTYKYLFIEVYALIQFCENFADFIHRYADSGSGYQTELKSGIEA